MTNLFGGAPKVIPEFTGLQVNTAVQVLPIPIIYGAPRVSINLIYYNGFNVQEVNSQSGKGILSGGKGQKEVEYFATVILAIGEGVLGSVLIIYQDQDVWTPENYPSNGSYYTNGNSTQTPWSYIEDNWGGDARSYKDTSYYGFSNAQLDSSATVPQIDLVMQGHLSGTSPLNNDTIVISTGQYDQNGNAVSYIGNILLGYCDADPGHVILDFLTNATYGATFPSEWVDTSTLLTSSDGYIINVGDNAVSTFCQAVGLAWSVVLNNAESANSILERWCKNLNVAPVWNGQYLRFIPYWDQYNGNNPNWYSGAGIAQKYFSPYVNPVVAITIDQILQSESKDEDPIAFMRKDPQEVYNTVRLDFRDRNNFFNDVPAEVKDENHIELYGPRIDNIGLANEYTKGLYAVTAASQILRRNISIMNTYTWKMGPLWGWLDPMTPVTIPDPCNYADTILVRIISVEDDEDENVTVTAEELPVGAQSPTIVPMTDTTPPSQAPTNVGPSPAYPPVMFEPTTSMATAQGFSTPQFILGTSGGGLPSYANVLDPNWGGCNVWISLDEVSYQLLATLTLPSIVGATTSPLPAYPGSNPDTVDTLYVNLNESDGVLASTTDVAAAAGHSICCIQDASGFEILSYTTATLVSSYTFALTGLYRGLYGTTPRYFGAGSNFLYVGTNANIVETNLPAAYIGQTFYVKQQSFNAYKTVYQDLSDCIAYQLFVNGSAPIPPVAPPSMQQATYRRVGLSEKSPVVYTKIGRRKWM